MGLITPYPEFWDRPLDGENNEGHIGHLCGNLVYGVVAAVMKICFRYSVRGRERLRAFKGKSGVLLAGNHTSYLEIAFGFVAVRPGQWVRYVARESLFTVASGLLGQLFSRVGAFPIKRDSADRSAIRRAVKMLKNKEVVGIMPEGTRRGKGSLEPELHSGAALIARMGQAPILPYTVRNAEKIKRKGKRLRFPKVSVEFGVPFLVTDFDFLPKEERLEACTWYAMRECYALFFECPPEEVNMGALFPETKNYTEALRGLKLPERSVEELTGVL